MWAVLIPPTCQNVKTTIKLSCDCLDSKNLILNMRIEDFSNLSSHAVLFNTSVAVTSSKQAKIMPLLFSN